MSLPKREKELLFDLVGNTTGERFKGRFTIKRILTQREEFLADIRRRSILGPSPSEALASIVQNAYALGQLSVRIVNAPKWWNPNEEEIPALDLEDENVIASLFDEALTAETEWRKEIEDAATEKKVVKTVEKASKKEDLNEPDEG